MATLDGPLDVVIKNDLHGLLLIPGKPLRLRRNGKVVDVGELELDALMILDLVLEVAPKGGPPSTEVGSRWKFVYRRAGIDFEFSAALTPEGWSVGCSPKVRTLGAWAKERDLARVASPAAVFSDRIARAIWSSEANGDAVESEQPATADGAQGGTEETGRAGGVDLRQHPRIPIRIEIEFTVESMSFSAQISDLGVGGAFVDTPNPLAEGTELDYEFCLPGDPRPIEGRARVAWRQEMLGMGIEFLSQPLIFEESPQQFEAM